MSKFRRKPTTIEAEQFDGHSSMDPPGVFRRPEDHSPYVVTIHDQRVYLAPGDWIVPEPDGVHYYPIKDEVFRNSYDPVDQSAFSAGDTVRLKSGGPVMTVISMVAGAVECAWFMAASSQALAVSAGVAYLQGQASTQTFPTAALEKVEPPKAVEPAA